MAASSLIIDDEFRPGFHRQTQWGWSMATAFFFGEAGAGLFLVSLFLDYLPGLVLGLLLTSIGKTTGHLLHLGQPARAWRAIRKVRSSWVSRGLLAIIVFTGCGALYILQRAQLDLGLLTAPFSMTLAVLAGASAIVIMLYQGLAMSHSPAIALWSTGILPMMSGTYAVLAGAGLVLGMESVTASRLDPSTIGLLRGIVLALAVYLMLMHFCLLHAARHGAQGARASAELLLRGELAGWFLGAVILSGLVLPAAILLVASAPAADAAAVLCALTGYYAYRVVIFKAGVYDRPERFAVKLRKFN